MNLFRKEFLLVSIVMGVVIISPVGNSYGQMIMDLGCSGCIQIENSESLELHRILELPIILWAHDFTYTFDHNSKITIKGHSNLNNPDAPIVFTVTSPIGNLVTAEQIMVQPNTDFQVEFNPSGPLWKEDGMYIIKAQAGPQSTIFKTNVQLVSIDSLSSLECDSSDLTVRGDNGGQYCISYESTNPLTQFTGLLSTNTKTLSLDVNGNYAQTLEINIERNLLNAKSADGSDADFIVMVNGESADYEEVSGVGDSRTLSISFGPGATTIEIIGTSVIPEFGSIAVLILVSSVIAGIFLTSGRVKIFPKLS